MDHPGHVGHIAIAEASGCVQGRQVGDDAVGRLRRRRVAELGLGSEDNHLVFFFFAFLAVRPVELDCQHGKYARRRSELPKSL